MSTTPPEELGIPGLTDPERIGSGGFAVVYRAFQPAFKRPVAVKVITAEVDDRARRRFERECEALGVLSEHPGIVTVHDAGFTAAGRPYLVMAYLSGGSLADHLARTGPLGWQTTLRLGGQLAGALAAAHAAGVTHCDLKPANVLTTGDGTPQLADFGIARLSGDQTTRTAGVTASFLYAPPEVINGHTPEAASDIYSFGATMHELITGMPPFPPRPDEALPSLLRRILDEPAPDLTAAGVPPAVASLVRQTLAKDPAHRPTSAGDLARSLQALSRDHEVAPADALAPPSTGEEQSPGVALAATAFDGGLGAATAPGYATFGSTGYRPTHRVPWTGMHAWNAPDHRLAVTAVLDPDLDVAVLAWHGDWARVRCSNRWEAWVDGRLLVPIGW